MQEFVAKFYFFRFNIFFALSVTKCDATQGIADDERNIRIEVAGS